MPNRKEHLDPAPKAQITPSLLGDLLDFAAWHPVAGIVHTFPVPPVLPADERQVQHVQDAGLAPLLYLAMREGFVQVPDGCLEALRGADLAAQVRHANRVEVAAEVIDVCGALGAHATLLKGISISGEHYPAQHLRPMGDIDILVPAQAAEAVEGELLRRGYQRLSDPVTRQGGHHGIPLYHADLRVWTEIHTALFPTEAAIGGTLFTPSSILAESVPSTFCGRSVLRLRPEMQLVYLATGWLRDLSGNAIHPTLAVPLFDAVYLLKAKGDTLDWDFIARRLDSDKSSIALHQMLIFLSRRGAFPAGSPFLAWLGARQRTVGAFESKIIQGILDTYLMAGRPFPRYVGAWHASAVFNALLAPGVPAVKLARIPWNVLFPPAFTGRYDLRWQSRRIAALLRRWT